MRLLIHLLCLLSLLFPVSADALMLRRGMLRDRYPFNWQQDSNYPGSAGMDSVEVITHVVCTATLPMGHYVILDGGAYEVADFDWDGSTVTRTNDPAQLTWTDVASGRLVAAKSLQNHPNVYVGGSFYIGGRIVDSSKGFSPVHYIKEVTFYVSDTPSLNSPNRAADQTKPTDPMAGGDAKTPATETADDISNGRGGPCPSDRPGMLRYSAHMLLASLYMVDRPLSYTPAFGPNINFRISYSHRDIQPVPPVSAAADGFSNLGPQWTCSWFSYITDDPTSTANAAVYVRGGGTETYEGFDVPSQAYAPDPESHARLVRLTANSYEKQFPSGCRYRYEQSDGSTTAPRRIFLTKVIDPQGNEATLTYNGFNRLQKITDATGKDTVLSYDNPGSYYLVTKVTDPFGRAAQIQYNANGQLWKITDAIGLTSEVLYEAGGNFINTLNTPYGTSTFSHGEDATGQWVQMTDALGSTERVEYRDYAPGIEASEPSAPAGFFNSELDLRNTFFWDKKAQMAAPGDYHAAHITHWLKSADGNTTTGVVESEKAPLEGRVWYAYPDQAAGNLKGSSDQPIKIARLLDDGTTQMSQFSYNKWGRVLQQIDPVGRSTTYSYVNDDLDLHEVRQTSPGINELLSSMTDYTGHQPQTVTDASGQVTHLTYTPQGQPLTVTNAKSELTQFAYYTNVAENGFGRVHTVTAAFGTPNAATHSFVYDNMDRVQSVTDQDNYTLTYSYDALGTPPNPLQSLDRVTVVTHPDNTTEKTVYNRLDAEDAYDRLGRKTHTEHDALQRVAKVTDPNGHMVQYGWCACGAMDKIIDANNVTTLWTRDLQKRPYQKVINGVTVATTNYEDSTSRVAEIIDGRNQRKDFTYYVDDHLNTVTYTDEFSGAVPALSVHYTYDQNYDRLSTMTDGQGQTTYQYNPIVSPHAGLGAGKLSSVSGPSGNQATGYTITYQYDELGRQLHRLIDGAANDSSVEYDNLGRVKTSTSALGTFQNFYVGATGRLDHVTYPSSQQVNFAYDTTPLHDQRLLEIKNLDPVGNVLSKFNYSHAANGRIETWTQFYPELGNPHQYTFEYDGADQLRTAQLTDATTGATLRMQAYSYDPAGNRLTAQTDNAVTTLTYNLPFQLLLDAGGLMYFRGTLNENATVTIGGQATTVTPNPGGGTSQPFQFEGWATVAAGVNNLPILATEADVAPGLNPQVTTRHVQLTVPGFNTKITGFDNGGNMTYDYVSSFTWDAANRLVGIASPGVTTTLIYDGLGRRVKMVQAGAINSERHYIWNGMSLAEERDQNNQVLKRYFTNGEQRVSGATATNYFYTRDHLGSLREMTDQGGNIHARYDYDVWGKRTKQSGDLDADFGFTGHVYHSSSQLHLAPYRAYSGTLGRWISRDPAGESAGTNLYAYVENDPVNKTDFLGLYITFGPGDYANWNNRFAGVWSNRAFRFAWDAMLASSYDFHYNPDCAPDRPASISGSANLRIDDDGSGSRHQDDAHDNDTSLHINGQPLNADRFNYVVAPLDILGFVAAGDPATITANGHVLEAPVGEFGPPLNGFGEASVAAVHALGVPTRDVPHTGPVIPDNFNGGLPVPTTVTIFPRAGFLPR